MNRRPSEATITSAEWRAAVREVIDRARASKAPHRPLLLLYLLGRARRAESAEVSFREVDKGLDSALSRFGRAKKAEALLPFWHLQTSTFWEIPGADSLPRRAGKDRPTRGALLHADASGRIPAAWWSALGQGDLASELGELVLQAMWESNEDRVEAAALTRFSSTGPASGS